MQANVSEFGEPDLAKYTCILALINEQIIGGWHPRLTEASACFS